MNLLPRILPPGILNLSFVGEEKQREKDDSLIKKSQQKNCVGKIGRYDFNKKGSEPNEPIILFVVVPGTYLLAITTNIHIFKI